MEILLAGTIASVHFFQIEAVVALPACSIFNRPRSTAWATNNPPLSVLKVRIAVLVNLRERIGLCQLSNASFHLGGILFGLQSARTYFIGGLIAVTTLGVVRIISDDRTKSFFGVRTEVILVAQGAVFLTLEGVLEVHHQTRGRHILVVALTRASVPLVELVSEVGVLLAFDEILECVFENACGLF